MVRGVVEKDGKYISPYGIDLIKLNGEHAAALLGFLEMCAKLGDRRSAREFAGDVIEELLSRFPELGM